MDLKGFEGLVTARRHLLKACQKNGDKICPVVRAENATFWTRRGAFATLSVEFVKNAIRQTCNNSVNQREVWVDKTGMDLVARSSLFRYSVVNVGGQTA